MNEPADTTEMDWDVLNSHDFNILQNFGLSSNGAEISGNLVEKPDEFTTILRNCKAEWAL